MYIRPFAFSIDDALGVKKPDKAKLMIVASPVGPYYATGFKPVSLFCASDAIRSAPKGTGAFKLGGYLYIYVETMPLLSKLRLKHKNMDISRFYGFLRVRSVRWALPICFSPLRTRVDR